MGSWERGVTSPVSQAVTTAWVRSRSSGLVRIRLTSVLTVASVTTSRAAISGLDRPPACRRPRRPQHAALPLARAADRVRFRRPDNLIRAKQGIHASTPRGVRLAVETNHGHR